MKHANQYFGLMLFLIFFCSQLYGQKSELVYATIKSEHLKQAAYEVNHEKSIIIYLPPNYHTSNKQYPVIYYLPGFTSPIEELIEGEYGGFQLQMAMDSLILSGQIDEMIVVLCDGSNFLGGSFYVNSPLTGRYEDFIVEEVVGYLEAHFRTLKKPSSRGISGHSMGGFGAFNLAMKHPDTFGIAYMINPGLFDEQGLQEYKLFNQQEYVNELHQLANTLNETPAESLVSLNNFKTKVGELLNDQDTYYYALTLAYGAAFCGNQTLDFPHITLPNTKTTPDNLHIAEFACWQNGFGHLEAKVAENKAQLLALQNIALDCGLNDSWVTKGTQYLSKQLVYNKIPFDMYWHSGHHDDELHNSLENRMLPYFSQHFEFE